jgi:hypothetical protein
MGVLALGRIMRCLLYLLREDTPILLVASVVRLPPNGWEKQIHESMEWKGWALSFRATIECWGHSALNGMKVEDEASIS